MLHHRSLPLELWGEAVNTTIYILNRVSSRTLHGATPFTKWYGEPLDVSYFREFGSICYGHVPKQVRQKLDRKARECLFVGYCTTTKAYRLWCFSKCKIIITCDVIFDEATPIQQQLQPATPQVPPDYSLLFPFDTSIFTNVSLSVNTIPSMSSPSTSLGTSAAVGASSPHLHEAVGASQLGIHAAVGASYPHLHEAVGATHSPLSTSGFEPHQHLSTSRDISNPTLSPQLFESFQILPIPSSGSSDTSPLPNSFNSAVSSTYNSSCEQSISPHASSISPDHLNPILNTRSLADIYRSAPPVQSISCVAASKVKPISRVSVLPPEPQTFAQAVKSDHKAE